MFIVDAVGALKGERGVEDHRQRDLGLPDHRVRLRRGRNRLRADVGHEGDGARVRDHAARGQRVDPRRLRRRH